MSTANPQTKRPKSRRKSKATIFTHRKFLWLEQVARDRRLPALSSAVSVLLSPYFNLSHDGAAWPYQDTLAASLGVRREAVNRVINALVERAHLEVTTTRGRHKPSVYRLVLKETAATKCAQESTLSEPKMCAENVRIREGKCAPTRTQIPLKTPWASKEAPRRERKANACAFDSSPGGAAPLTGCPAEEDSPTAAPSARQESPVERSRSVAREERSGDEKFRELRAIWARPWADDDAADRRAFEAACREVAPDDIIEAAQTWVAAFEAGDGVRFLPPLARWLAARGWEKPPPQRKASAHNGARPRYGRKPNVAEIGADLVRQYEADRQHRINGGLS